MLNPPFFFADLWEVACWRISSGRVATIWAMPSMWPAIARTSHPGQSVDMAHCSTVKSLNMVTTRSYSVVLGRRQRHGDIAVQRGLACLFGRTNLQINGHGCLLPMGLVS